MKTKVFMRNNSNWISSLLGLVIFLQGNPHELFGQLSNKDIN